MSKTFEQDLTQLINYHSQENGSDTPDWILAQYMIGCLNAFNVTVRAREKWYGRPEPSMVDGQGGHTKPNTAQEAAHE